MKKSEIISVKLEFIFSKDLIFRTLYLKLLYTERFYISRCAELPSLTAHGKTQEHSLKEIKTAVLGALKWMKKEKEALPEPFHLYKFSGQFRIRISPEKHRQIAIESSLQNISMNQFIVNKL